MHITAVEGAELGPAAEQRGPLCLSVHLQPLIGGTGLLSDLCNWATGLIAIITTTLQLVNHRRRGAIRSDSGNFDTTVFFGLPLVPTACLTFSAQPIWRHGHHVDEVMCIRVYPVSATPRWEMATYRPAGIELTGVLNGLHRELLQWRGKCNNSLWN